MSLANPYRRRPQRASPLAQDWVKKGVTRCTIYIVFPELDPRYNNTVAWEIVEGGLLVYVYLRYTRRVDPFITRTNLVTRLVLAARTEAAWSFEGWSLVSRVFLAFNNGLISHSLFLDSSATNLSPIPSSSISLKTCVRVK